MLSKQPEIARAGNCRSNRLLGLVELGSVRLQIFRGQSLASESSASFSGSARQETFLLPSRPLRNDFQAKERALATGIFNSGTNIGATLAPFAVGFLLYRFGWRYTFLATSLFAVIWLILWFTTYRSPAEHFRVTRAELAYLNEGATNPTSKIKWSRLLIHRQTWAFLAGKIITDSIWWFYRFGLSIAKMGIPLLIVYNVCTLGSIFGGWLPARSISLGWSVNRARKTLMFLYAVAITPIMLVGRVHNLWQAVALISLATAAHQAWLANLFTLASDMFPRRAVASVVGMGACGGPVSMMFFGLFIGLILQLSHGSPGLSHCRFCLSHRDRNHSPARSRAKRGRYGVNHPLKARIRAYLRKVISSNAYEAPPQIAIHGLSKFATALFFTLSPGLSCCAPQDHRYFARRILCVGSAQSHWFLARLSRFR